MNPVYLAVLAPQFTTKKICIELPYDTGISKNRAFIVARNRIITSPQMRRIKEVYGAICNHAFKDSNYEPKKKVYLAIYVFKKDHRSDAINVLDVLCDVIKKAINVDDRYFSIVLLDWGIDPISPRIHVGVFQ